MTIYRVLDSPTIFNYAIIHSDGTVQHEPSLKRIRLHVTGGIITDPVKPISRADFNALVARCSQDLTLYDVEIHFTLPAADADAAHKWVINALSTVLEEGMPENYDWWAHEDNVREVPNGHDFA